LGDFSSNVIRSSGLSRSVMIILIPLFYLILNDKIKFFFLQPIFFETVFKFREIFFLLSNVPLPQFKLL